MGVKFLGAVFSALLAITLFTSCSHLGLITGKGDIIHQSYNYSGFTEIEIGSAFEVEINPSEVFTVTVSSYQNIINYVDVSQVDKTLKIRLKPGKYTNSRPKATVSLPALYHLDLSGASRANAKGFILDRELKITESGASYLEIDFQASNAAVNISGASKLDGLLQAVNLNMDVSSASRIDLSGKANKMSLTVSGASQVDLSNFELQVADVNLSGASRGNIVVSGDLDIDLSGASSLTYSGNPALGNVSVTGASSLNSKK